MEPFLVLMAQIGMTTNVALLALNLFPLPPLDGGRVLAGTLPPQTALTLARVEPFGFFIVMELACLVHPNQTKRRTHQTFHRHGHGSGLYPGGGGGTNEQMTQA